MEQWNPYSPPLADTIEIVRADRPGPIIRRGRSLTILGASIAGAVIYTFMDEVIVRTAVGAWPMLFTTCVVSILASILTRDWMIAPLCCFAAVLAGDLLQQLYEVGPMENMGICIPMAAGFSIPSLVIGYLLYRRAIGSRQVTQEVS